MSTFTSIDVADLRKPPPSALWARPPSARRDTSEIDLEGDGEVDELVDELDIATDDDELAEEELAANGGASAGGSRVRAKPSTERTPGKTLLPLSRVETIVHSQGEVTPFTKEALFALCVATEEFMKLSAETGWSAVPTERRSIANYRDMAGAMARQKRFYFLQDTIPMPMTLERAMALHTSGVRTVPAPMDIDPPAKKSKGKAAASSSSTTLTDKQLAPASVSSPASTSKGKGKSKVIVKEKGPRDRAYHNGHAAMSASAIPRRESRRVQERSARQGPSADGTPLEEEEQQQPMDIDTDPHGFSAPMATLSRRSHSATTTSPRKEGRSSLKAEPTLTSTSHLAVGNPPLGKIKVRPSPHANGHGGASQFSRSSSMSGITDRDREKEKDKSTNRRGSKRPTPTTPSPTKSERSHIRNGEHPAESPLHKRARLSHADSAVTKGRSASPAAWNSSGNASVSVGETNEGDLGGAAPSPRKWAAFGSSESGGGLFGAAQGRTIYSASAKQSGV